MFGRKKSGKAEPEARPEGEPTPAGGSVRPESSVLDELSRAFGTDTTDDNADLIAGDSDGTDGTVEPIGRAGEAGDAGEAGEAGAIHHVEELQIVMSDDDGPHTSEPRTPTPPAERTTIRIGDDFGSVAFDAVPVSEPIVFATDPGLTRGPGLAEDAGADSVSSVDLDPSVTPDPTIARSTIAIGGDDDLPDAVYLDGGLEPDDDSGTVFIDDDGTGDALGIKDATTPGIEPRLRQRRIGVRRAASRKRIKWVLLGAAGLMILLGVLTVLGSGWFAIDDIEVSGAVYTDENRLQLVIDDLDGTPVLLADTEAAELELEAIPWVDDARVRTRFPNSATIEIRERTPVATMAGADGRFRVLDDEGRVLDVIEGQPVAFVLLGGPSTLDLAAGEFAPVGPASAASLVTKLTPTIRPRVLSIEVTDDGSDLVMNLRGDPAGEGSAEETPPIRVRFGSAIGDSEQLEKLVRLEDRLDDLSEEPISEINVTTNEVTDL